MTKVAARRTGEPILPSADEMPSIMNYARLLEESGFLMEMPPTLARAVRLVVEELSKGRGVAVVPFGQELSTQQAANLLSVSRPFLIGLLERQEIPSHRVGTHRRVRLEDVLRYREQRSDNRRRQLRDLLTEGQSLGLEY